VDKKVKEQEQKQEQEQEQQEEQQEEQEQEDGKVNVVFSLFILVVFQEKTTFFVEFRIRLYL
jgi:hypothetical protein